MVVEGGSGGSKAGFESGQVGKQNQCQSPSTTGKSSSIFFFVF